jgi:hypothetical protein
MNIRIKEVIEKMLRRIRIILEKRVNLKERREKN